MTKNLFWVLALVLCVSSSAFADQQPKEEHKYYLGASFGFASINYHANPTYQAFSDAQSSFTNTHIPYALDLVFLFAMPDGQTGVGVNGSFILDAYYPKSTYDYAAVRQSSLALTVRHFFGDEIGHGAFVRGDLGGVSVDSTADALNYSAASPSSGGFLWLVGGGYGFRLSNQVSFNLEVDYSRVSLSGGAISNVQYKGGILLYL